MKTEIVVEIGNIKTSIHIDGELRRLINEYVIDTPYHRGILYDKYFTNANRVNDVHRYTVVIKGNTVVKLVSNKNTHNSQSRYRDKDPTIGRKTILIILESPHKDEYSYPSGMIQPIAPAQGKTGKGIDLFIRDKISHIISNKNSTLPDNTYQVILMNSICWQTSLYVFYNDTKTMHGDLKNKIWTRLWGLQAVKDDFNKRLIMYQPDLIINACTGANYGDTLKSAVRQEIKKTYMNKIFPIGHPSSWKNIIKKSR